MKHLPNLLTLGNLFCGCIAIAYTITAMPYYTFKVNQFGPPTYEWVYGVQQMYLGAIFIGIAAIFDLFAGLTARALKVFSPIGKDLDSLADMVSFGVAPSMIMYQLLWDASMGEKNVFDVSMLYMAPAFLIACFAALRLARYNVDPGNQKNSFVGMPSPAAGMFVATLPLLVWYNPFHMGELLKNRWLLYTIIALVCWLMVSGVRFFKLLPGAMTLGQLWPRLVLLVALIAGFLFLGWAALTFTFLLYIVLAFIHKSPEPQTISQP
jgi:CDP-diacylglycerol---serine O-phosphatidyltransferase